MPQSIDPSAVLSASRVLPASAQEIYAAFENPESLATWWGPNGFTNTFQQFEFTPGGNWVFVMHGPNGANYDNASVFRELRPGAKIVIEHTSAPWFLLTVTLTPQGNQTHVAWEQQFESPAVAEKLAAVCRPGNDQNLERLEALLVSKR